MINYLVFDNTVDYSGFYMSVSQPHATPKMEARISYLRLLAASIALVHFIYFILF